MSNLTIRLLAIACFAAYAGLALTAYHMGHETAAVLMIGIPALFMVR